MIQVLGIEKVPLTYYNNDEYSDSTKPDTSTSTSYIVIFLSSTSAGIVIIIITAILIICTCYMNRKPRKLYY